MFARFLTKLILLSSLLASWAQATTINYTITDLGESRWRYDYAIHNDSLDSALQEFTLYFNDSLYANLSDESTAAGFDLLLIQPDTAIPAAGIFDGLALQGGIAAGAWLDGFSVSFDYLGQGTPASQLFSIVDPSTFIELDTGLTSRAAVPIPAPATLALVLLGLAGVAVQRRRQGGAQ